MSCVSGQIFRVVIILLDVYVVEHILTVIAEDFRVFWYLYMKFIILLFTLVTSLSFHLSSLLDKFRPDFFFFSFFIARAIQSFLSCLLTFSLLLRTCYFNFFFFAWNLVSSSIYLEMLINGGCSWEPKRMVFLLIKYIINWTLIFYSHLIHTHDEPIHSNCSSYGYVAVNLNVSTYSVM